MPNTGSRARPPGRRCLQRPGPRRPVPRARRRAENRFCRFRLGWLVRRPRWRGRDPGPAASARPRMGIPRHVQARGPHDHEQKTLHQVATLSPRVRYSRARDARERSTAQRQSGSGGVVLATLILVLTGLAPEAASGGCNEHDFPAPRSRRAGHRRTGGGRRRDHPLSEVQRGGGLLREDQGRGGHPPEISRQ